jgi:hypothetical protein
MATSLSIHASTPCLLKLKYSRNSKVRHESRSLLPGVQKGIFIGRANVSPTYGRGFFMTRAACLVSAVLFILFVTPARGTADYLYPGSAALQPLAVIEPAAPDSLFNTWTGDLELAGRQNLGFSLDNLRNDDNSKDWDVILAATGTFKAGSNLLLGVTVPYIIRDPDYNESDLLDLRIFARTRLIGQAPAFRVSGEVSAILPTASEGDPPYPFSLQSSVVGARLALAGGSEGLRAGINFGYQTYLATESGDDSDVLYGLWMEKQLKEQWMLAGVYSSSQHRHSGTPGNDETLDNYMQIGIHRVQSDVTRLGLAVGSGIGSESAADRRVTATVTFRFGETAAAGEQEKASGKAETITEKEAARIGTTPAAPYSGPVVIMVAEKVANRETEKRVMKALQQKGFATGMDPDPGVSIPRENVLLYNPGVQEKAVSVSRILVMGGYLKDLRIEESKKPLTQNWMHLILGGERK